MDTLITYSVIRARKQLFCSWNHRRNHLQTKCTWMCVSLSKYTFFCSPSELSSHDWPRVWRSALRLVWKRSGQISTFTIYDVYEAIFATGFLLIFSFLFQMQLLIAALVVFVLSSVEAKPLGDEHVDDPEPKFCNGLECPHFKTINKTTKYELRCYQTDYKWVSTIVAGRFTILLLLCMVQFLLLLPPGQPPGQSQPYWPGDGELFKWSGPRVGSGQI